MKHKTRGFELKRMKTVEDDVGGWEFEGEFSVLDVLDSDNDRLVKGSFTKSLEKRLPKIKDHHGVTVGQATTAKESDTALVVAGRIYPTSTGKDLAVLMQQIDTEDGPHAPVEEGSIGFTSSKGGREKNDDGGWDYHEVEVWEVSPVTFGANDQTSVGLKSRTHMDGSYEKMGQDMAEALTEQGVLSGEVWAHSTFDDHVVVSQVDNGPPKLWEVGYEMNGDTFVFGTPSAVETVATVQPKADEMIEQLGTMKTEDAIKTVGVLLNWALHGPSGVHAVAKRRASEDRELGGKIAAEAALLMMDSGDALVGLASTLARADKASNAQMRHLHGIIANLTSLVHGYPEPPPAPEPVETDTDEGDEAGKASAEELRNLEAEWIRRQIEDMSG